MAQVIKKEKIGLLTYGAGTITLAASVLTIGGQQYTTNALNLTVPTVTANTLYMIYAVQTAGVVSLVQSTNVNSVGPAGYLSWKLVGAYYSSGVAVPAFGGFVTIDGSPETARIPYTPVISWAGTAVATGFWWRKGKDLFFETKVDTGASPTPGSTVLVVSTPTGQSFDSSVKVQLDSYTALPDNSSAKQASGGYKFYSVFDTATTIRVVYQSSNTAVGAAVTTTTPVTFGSGDFIITNGAGPIVGWNNTALKDL